MMEHLPPSLIEVSRLLLERNLSSSFISPSAPESEGIGRMCVGTLRGIEIDGGITAPLLDESVVDWIKSTVGKDNPHKHDDISDYHFSKLLPHEVEAVVKYTYNSFPLNQHLKDVADGKTHLKQEVDVTKERDRSNGILVNLHPKHLESAANKCDLPRDLTTYSGISDPADSFYAHTKSFMSSSTDPVAAHMFALHKTDSNGVAHIAKIYHSRGQRGIYVGSHRQLTLTPSEFEYIIPPHTEFRVDDTPEEVMDSSGKLTHKIWTFKRIN